MALISAEEIQQDVSACPQRVKAGETLIVLGEGKSVRPQAETDRPFGLVAGEFVAPNVFDASLLEDIIEAFKGR